MQTNLNRRAFLKTKVAGVAGAAAAIATPAVFAQGTKVKWRLVSTWPNTMDILHGNFVTLGKRITEVTDGRIEVQVFSAGELVPGYQVLDAVRDGVAECGGTAGMYYTGKQPALVFDSGVPFGLTTRQQHTWQKYGGGSDLMRALYEDFGVIQYPAGSTGELWGGWFKKEVKDVADLKGLRIRAPGFIAEIYSKIGAVPQLIPHSDVFPALQKGTLDAVKMIGPYEDEKLGLWKAANYFYAPNPLELTAACCFIANKKAWASISKGDREAIIAVCQERDSTLASHYDAVNTPALQRTIAKGVKVGFWPQPIIKKMYEATKEVMTEAADKDPTFKKVYDQWRPYATSQIKWGSISVWPPEQAIIALTTSDNKK